MCDIITINIKLHFKQSLAYFHQNAKVFYFNPGVQDNLITFETRFHIFSYYLSRTESTYNKDFCIIFYKIL